MGREGFEPPKAIGRQIYSLVQLTALPPAPASATVSLFFSSCYTSQLNRNPHPNRLAPHRGWRM